MTNSNGSPPAVQPSVEPSASEPTSVQVLRPAGRRRNAEIDEGGGNPTTRRWFTDRSRYEAGFSCPFSRLLRYHIDGTGWQAPDSPEQAVGSRLHAILENVLLAARDKGAPLTWPETNDILATKDPNTQPQYQATIDGDPPLLHAEIHGLIHAWVRGVLPWLMENYTIVDAEKEFSIDVGDDIIWMARPDGVVIHKESGLPCVVEFKSTRAKADRMAALHAASLQTIMNAFAVSSHYNQPCGEVQIHMLQLGTPDWPTPITHAYYRIANPPHVTEDWQPKSRGPSGQWLGKLYRKVPVHEFRPTVSWIWSMPEAALLDTVPLAIVPTQTQTQGLKVVQALASIRNNEAAWRRLISSINWETSTFADLAELVPRSFQCHTYNRMCDFTNVCFDPANHTAAQGLVPFGFSRRVPHHPQEEQ